MADLKIDLTDGVPIFAQTDGTFDLRNVVVQAQSPSHLNPVERSDGEMQQPDVQTLLIVPTHPQTKNPVDLFATATEAWC